MNLNDFFSKPTRIKEAYINNYPSSNPPAAAAAASSDSDGEPTFDRLTGEPKFNRLDKSGSDPEFDFRTGLAGDDETEFFEPDVRIGKPVEPDAEDTDAFMSAVDSYGEQNPYMQSWGGKYATGSAGGNSPSSIAPYGWRYVEKGEDPARYGSDTISGSGTPDWRSIAANASPSSKSASASGLPKMRFDIASQRLVPVDQPIALDLSPNVKNGSNPNIDAETRARALAWAARKNAPGGLRAQDVGPDNSVPAVVKPVAAAPAVVKPAAKPAEVPAAVTLKDLPAEKPMSWKDIAQANSIDHPNRIMPGQVLKIPGKADYVVQPGDTLADIAAGKTKAPKYTPSPGQDPDYVAALEKLKKHPNIGVDAPIPRDMQKALGMGPITTKTYDPFGKEIVQKVGREEILTPSIIKKQDYNPTPAEAMAALRANEKAMAAKIAARDAEREANRKKVKEDDIDEDTMDDGFKWGSPTMPMQDGSVMNFNPQTNSYKQASPPTKPNLNTSMSTITRDRTTDKSGQVNQNYSDVSIAMNPATGTGDYMHRQDVNGVPTTTFRKDVPADELAKLRTGAGIPPAQQAVKESIDRMRFLAGIRKK